MLSVRLPNLLLTDFPRGKLHQAEHPTSSPPPTSTSQAPSNGPVPVFSESEETQSTRMPGPLPATEIPPARSPRKTLRRLQTCKDRWMARPPWHQLCGFVTGATTRPGNRRSRISVSTTRGVTPRHRDRQPTQPVRQTRTQTRRKLGALSVPHSWNQH